ncbi:unnamed protein product [Dicrocoelium dendriticum]|nr:unnamed protein product [Dicrocoelium dendriticum]
MKRMFKKPILSVSDIGSIHSLAKEPGKSVLETKSQVRSGAAVDPTAWGTRATQAEKLKVHDIDRIGTATKKREPQQQSFLPYDAVGLKKRPQLVDVAPDKRETLLLKKVEICCTVFDFGDSSRDLASKEVKRLTLVELADYMLMQPNMSSEPVYAAITELLKKNALRTPVPTRRLPLDGFDKEEEEDEENADPSWMHLKWVYEIFLRFVSRNDFQPTLGKKYITSELLTDLMPLFDSADSHERDYVKQIVHRIYEKIVSLRPLIRQLISCTLLGFIYEEDSHNGIRELLQIMESIINGFQLPLKSDHEIFLRKILLPLHKTPSVATYHYHLMSCIMEYIKKDNSLIHPIILEGILRFWPRTNSYKEVLFLDELESCIEYCDSDNFRVILRPSFMHLACCISSENFQVSERALLFWNNERLLSMMTENAREIIPVIYESLLKAINHWNRYVY